MLDAAQSIGQMPIDLKEIGCDFLCATGRKYLRGPRGTGFLYACRSKLEFCNPPFIDLQAATWISDNEYTLQPTARRFETWEQNIAGKIGLSTAIDYTLHLGIESIWARVQDLSSQLRHALSHIPSITLQDIGHTKCGIVTFTHDKLSPQNIQKILEHQHINVSVSLQEYARLDLGARRLPAVVRASVHYYNTEAEVDRFCKVLSQLR